MTRRSRGNRVVCSAARLCSLPFTSLCGLCFQNAMRSVLRPASLHLRTSPPAHFASSAPRLTRRTFESGTHQATQAVCGSCSTPLPSALSTHCSSCGTIQPCPRPDARSGLAYALFRLGRPRYSIDKKELKSRFLQLQRAVHPDANVTKGGEKATERAREWSGWVNGAYRALDGDLSRAEYLVRCPCCDD